MQQVLTHAEQFMGNQQHAHAIALLNQTLKQTPSFYQGWLKLSQCLYEANYLPQARDIAQHAEQFDPLTTEFKQIQQAIAQKDYDSAAQIAKVILTACPHHPRALFTLAHLALSHARPQESVALITQHLEYVPANLSLRQLLLDSYLQADDYTGALQAAEALVALNECFETLWRWIGLLLKYSQTGGLLDACSRAAKFAHREPLKQSQLALIRGQTLRILGQRDESVKALQDSLHADPNNADAWWALADMKNYRFSAEEFRAIQRLAENQRLPGRTRSIATFALAKATELSSGIEPSMPLYTRANQLLPTQNTSLQQMETEFARRKKAFSIAALQTQAERLDNQPCPIFIVGMPRSGSTLIEQILASHPEIEGTIEQPTLPAIERVAQQLSQKHYQSDFFTAISQMDQKELTQLGQTYLDKGALFRRESCNYFIDKQPFNFRLIGLIHKILPNARIIDVRRHPLDCGLSLYKQFFHAGVDFSYHLRDIAKAINAYDSLMQHWHAMLPERIITVQYESLVTEPEEEIRRLLDKVGVCYDERCLHFHHNPRKIHTASSEQVREPLYTRSIDVWRRVESELAELQQHLHPTLL
ncbi:tetratricopeptide repeat-containing sulfotransferase family protein [Alteromonas flava]|uniref:tetratricopeptide repeat-containing sulfotransferase family protein n=1 Tax=Alteromonas flava TaxID=2048003 RepID=UPI0013DC8661|nr:tetratricopeptide repeat-containing sulfotransferase family protein [Alteromonas flava]